MKNILTEALVNLATNASFIFQLYKFCKVKDKQNLSLVRLVKSNMNLTGHAGGIEKKEILLEIEGIHV